MRFGEALLDRLDQALGDQPEVPVPYRPRPAIRHAVEFDGPTHRLETLREAVHVLIGRLCEDLERRAAGVCQLFVTFRCRRADADARDNVCEKTLEVHLSRPSRSAKHLRSLLSTRLESLQLPGPVESVTLWTPAIEPLDDAQEELFETGVSDARALGDLVDRLASRLGEAAVVRAELLDEYQPERAFRYVPMVDSSRVSPRQERDASQTPRTQDGGRCPPYAPADKPPVALRHCSQSSGTPRRPPPLEGVGHPQAASGTPRDSGARCDNDTRPLRLSARPAEIAATAIVPEGPPIAFRVHAIQHTVSICVGPERIETGWWRGPYVQRDYYRVTTDAGRHCWLFRERDSRCWFLHGWFD
jgi:protein ImuB